MIRQPPCSTRTYPIFPSTTLFRSVVPGRPAPEGELRLEHFAFAAEGLAEFLALLRRRGLPYRIGVLPALGTVQVNLHDPDGNHIHVDFAAAEAASVPEEPALAKATAGT